MSRIVSRLSRDRCVNIYAGISSWQTPMSDTTVKSCFLDRRMAVDVASCMHASQLRVLRRVCGGRRCVSGRKNSVPQVPAQCLPYLLHLVLQACPLYILMRGLRSNTRDAAAGTEECTVRVEGRYGSGCLEKASRGQACTQSSSTIRSWKPTERAKLNC